MSICDFQEEKTAMRFKKTRLGLPSHIFRRPQPYNLQHLTFSTVSYTENKRPPIPNQFPSELFISG